MSKIEKQLNNRVESLIDLAARARRTPLAEPFSRCLGVFLEEISGLFDRLNPPGPQTTSARSEDPSQLMMTKEELRELEAAIEAMKRRGKP